MRVRFKLFATLADYLPQPAKKNEVELEVTSGTTIDSLVTQYNLPRNLVHLVLVNGVYVEPAARSTTALKDGDVLAIWPPIAGGIRMKDEAQREYQMSISHEDFMRQLPDVFEGVPYEVSGNDINAKWPNRSLTIHLSAEGKREMGSLDLPSLTATFDFDGFSESDRLKFLERVQQHYQGAGGP